MWNILVDKKIKSLSIPGKNLRNKAKEINEISELLSSNEEKMIVELESSKKKNRVIKRYGKDRKN